MSHDEITARNQKNGQKSTGPKTAEGRAVSSQNARKHGATARPDPQAVANWLRVILGLDLADDDLQPEDAIGQAALRLAEAEARRVAAESATDAASGEEPEAETLLSIVYDIQAQIEDVMFFRSDNPKIMREANVRATRNLKRIAKYSGQEFRRADKLQRYEREAQRERQRALEDWVALNHPAQT